MLQQAKADVGCSQPQCVTHEAFLSSGFFQPECLIHQALWDVGVYHSKLLKHCLFGMWELALRVDMFLDSAFGSAGRGLQSHHLPNVPLLRAFCMNSLRYLGHLNGD